MNIRRSVAGGLLIVALLPFNLQAQELPTLPPLVPGIEVTVPPLPIPEITTTPLPIPIPVPSLDPPQVPTVPQPTQDAPQQTQGPAPRPTPTPSVSVSPVPVPQPTSVITQTVPGPTVTVTERPKEIADLPPELQEEIQEEIDDAERRGGVIGILFGLALALLAMLVVYYLGWRARAEKDKRFIDDLLSDVMLITRRRNK